MREFPKVFFMLLAIFASDAEAQLFSLGDCIQPVAITTAIPAMLAGQWFEYARTPTINDYKLRCVGATIATIAGATVLSIRLTATSFPATTITLNGNIAFTGIANEGRLLVTLSKSSFPLGKSKSQSYTIIGTDGTVVNNAVGVPPTYLSIYSCKSFGWFKLESGIILTTLRSPTAATIALATAQFTAQNLQVKALKVVSQANC